MLMKLTIGPLRCFKMSVKSKRFKIIRKGTENTLRAIKNSSALFGRRNKIIFQMDFKFTVLLTNKFVL
jgi:hypothetical protein